MNPIGQNQIEKTKFSKNEKLNNLKVFILLII